MNFFVKFLQDNGFQNPEPAVPLSTRLEWISSLNSPFIAWLFERIETIKVLDDDGQIRDWNGLTAKAPRNELDDLEAQIRQLNQEHQNIELKCQQLKLSMYDTTQANAAMKAEIQQQREKINFKDHMIADSSDQVMHQFLII